MTTPDPHQASGGPADPQSWNRYAYVQNGLGSPSGGGNRQVYVTENALMAVAAKGGMAYEGWRRLECNY